MKEGVLSFLAEKINFNNSDCKKSKIWLISDFFVAAAQLHYYFSEKFTHFLLHICLSFLWNTRFGINILFELFSTRQVSILIFKFNLPDQRLLLEYYFQHKIIFGSNPTLTIDLQAIYEGNLPINNHFRLEDIRQETFQS